jgi:hypothetical protein
MQMLENTIILNFRINVYRKYEDGDKIGLIDEED